MDSNTNRENQTVAALIRQLAVKNETERQQTRQAIRQLGPEGVEALLTLLRREDKLTYRRIILRLCVASPIYLVAILLFILGMIELNFRYPLPPLVVMLVGMVGCILPIQPFMRFVMVDSFYSRRRKEALTALAELEDLRGIAPLIEALTYPDKKLQALAADALTPLLPRLPSLVGERLSPLLRPGIHATLKSKEYRKDTPLLLALLKVVDQAGDSDDLKLIEILAVEVKRGQYDTEVVQAVERCLPVLRQRCEQQHDQRSLLRAASPANTETLLRPAAESPGTPSEQLLRTTSQAYEERP